MPKATHTVDAIELANYLLAVVGPMPHLKLQKLVYYVQAWHLAFFDEPLIDEDFQAWIHGPVSRKVWNHFKDDSSPLLCALKISAAEVASSKRDFPKKLTPEQKDLINDVLQEYSGRSAYHLECLTHAEQPWIDARRGLGIADRSSAVISRALMAKFYKTRVMAAN